MASNIFECGICNEDYNSANRKPISLLCGHTFCYSCLGRIGSTSGRNCPECRLPIHTPVDQLPVIFALIPHSQACGTQNNGMAELDRCSQHDCDLDHFCADCGVILCRKCSRLNHRQHQVEVMSDILKKDEIAANFNQQLQSKIEANINNISSALSKSTMISQSLDEVKACKLHLEQYEYFLLAMKVSATEDLNSWNATKSELSKAEQVLFKRLCAAWNGNGSLIHDEETTSDFERVIDALIARTTQTQKLAQELKASLRRQNNTETNISSMYFQKFSLH